MGRDKRNEDRAEHFTKMIRATMETSAWRALNPTAQALYPWLKLEWRGPQSNNNGRIRLSVRQAAQRLGVGINTAARAFQDLQAKGFLVVTLPARLGVSGAATCPCYEITEIALPHGTANTGRRLFKEWQAGADYPVIKATAHNPTGRNQNSKPCHQNEDSNVTKLVTRKAGTSPK
ncbi:hypothetical protein SAMN05216236_12313 [Sedimentitalea nanhaiensis]|uniref:Helix-turn-helix domain-containing protein n=1 Tax=Sedimentitalea nanhaiensis TaxID=999627 RepID=A0A1I7D5D2_9RHOB|nr:hypothetical protein SAMN05216236_12313 [Sedimentitalea nanhaiensis]